MDITWQKGNVNVRKLSYTIKYTKSTNTDKWGEKIINTGKQPILIMALCSTNGLRISVCPTNGLNPLFKKPVRNQSFWQGNFQYISTSKSQLKAFYALLFGSVMKAWHWDWGFCHLRTKAAVFSFFFCTLHDSSSSTESYIWNNCQGRLFLRCLSTTKVTFLDVLL